MSRTSPALVGLVFSQQRSVPAAATTVVAPSTLTVAKTATNSGDAQTGTAGVALPNPLRVVVTDGGWRRTGVDRHLGHAQRRNRSRRRPAPPTRTESPVTTWTLGAGGGAQTATASRVRRHRLARHVQRDRPGRSDDHRWRPAAQPQFSPATITISAGQTVRFVWATGATNHNVTPGHRQPVGAAGQPRPAGAARMRRQSFNATFPTAGTFRFFCTAHGANPSPGTVRACPARSRSTSDARGASMKYFASAAGGARRGAARGAERVRRAAGLARGADDGHQVGGHRVHPDAWSRHECHGGPRGTRPRRADGARGGPGRAWRRSPAAPANHSPTPTSSSWRHSPAFVSGSARASPPRRGGFRRFRCRGSRPTSSALAPTGRPSRWAASSSPT